MSVKQQAPYDYFSGLRYLMVEANSACNLSCAHCNRERLESFGWRSHRNLTQDQFRKVLEVFGVCPIDTIKFEGLSEPMLHPEFDCLSGMLRSFFPKAFVIIATNLQYRVTKTPLLRTLPYVDMVYLSIDGIQETYEKLRAGAKWHVLIQALEDIAQEVPLVVRNTKLHINFTLTPENFRELPEIYALRDRYGLASVRINLVQNWNEDQSNSTEFSDEIISFLKTYQTDLKGVAGWEYRECFWPFHGIVVDVFGDVRQCVINTSMKPIANIFCDNVREIYNESRHYILTRRLLLNNEPGPHCLNCDYHKLSPALLKVFGSKHKQNTPREFDRGAVIIASSL